MRQHAVERAGYPFQVFGKFSAPIFVLEFDVFRGLSRYL
jgi:hypothetical protein